MTSPFHSRDIKGRGRYYGSCQDGCPLGDDLFISVTNAQGIVAKPALVPAAVKVTADTAWEWLPQMVSYSRQSPEGANGCHKKRVADRCGDCRFCLTAAIKREHQNQWDSKADFGSLIHTYAYAHVIGKPMPYDEDVAPFIDQYLAFLTAWGVDITTDVEAAETTVFDRRHGYAGTGDIWLWLRLDPKTGAVSKNRHLWLIDLKTSLTKPATAVYADQVLQLAGLRYAPTALLADDSEVEVPKFAGAALLNLRAQAHALIPLPADKAAHRAFLAAVQLQRFFHDDVDTKAWAPLSAPAVVEPTQTRKAS